MTPEVVISVVAEVYGVTPGDITGSSRAQPIAEARQVAMTILRRNTCMTLDAIGAVFGRTHATVVHAVTVTEWRIRIEHELPRRYEAAERMLGWFGR